MHPILPLRPTKRLPHLPGTAGAPVWGHAWRFATDGERLLTEQAARHGGLFRLRILRRDMAVVGDPDLARTVLMDRTEAYSSHFGWKRALGEVAQGGLMLRDFEDHRSHRRRMQFAFRREALAGYTALLDDLFESAVACWPDDTTGRFYPHIKQLLLHAAIRLFTGEADPRVARALSRAFSDTVKAPVSIVQRPIPGLSFARALAGRKRIADYLRTQVADRRRSGGRDLLSQLCATTVDEGGWAFTDDEIVDHVLFLLFAAHETNAATATNMVAYMTADMRRQQHARNAVATPIDLDPRALPDDAHTWLMRETLRLRPALPAFGRRTTRTVALGDHVLPTNTALMVSPFLTGTHPDYWSDPLVFDPSRFSPTRREHTRHSHAWIPFGGGAHTCLGLRLAELEIRSLFRVVLRDFELTRATRRRERTIMLPVPRDRAGLPIRMRRR